MAADASFLWGIVAASSLVIGALLALRCRFRERTIGLLMAFGAGVLISAVAFDLIDEAFGIAGFTGGVVFGIFAGSAVFFGGDLVIDHLGGEHRKDMRGRQEEGSALAIVLGSVLDGIPESMVIGLTIALGGVIGLAYIGAVFISNLPEAMAATTGLRASGWSGRRVLGLWVGVMGACGLASLAGFVFLGGASPRAVGFVLAFAAGAILTMLADTMMPEALRHSGKLAGVVTTTGFAAAFGLRLLG